MFAALATLAATVGLGASVGCMAPKPAANFDLTSFYGTWYEIGRIQTAGATGPPTHSCLCMQLWPLLKYFHVICVLFAQAAP